MTVSKTTSETLSGFRESRKIPDSSRLMDSETCDFADSLTAELQKENTRLREALEKIEADNGCEHNHGLIAAAALSKEKE